MKTVQDLFISHAGADKAEYVLPLTQALREQKVTFWLDSSEIAWGDNIVMKINEGLRESKFALLCLSKNFLRRPWPENELSSILAIQNNTGMKRVLPLILNAKEEILDTYPLLAALAYREFSAGTLTLASELAGLLKKPKKAKGLLKVLIESVHTGQLCNLEIPPNVSVKWLSTKAQSGMGFKEAADVGAFLPFRIRWVLVDVKVEEDWHSLSRDIQSRIKAIIASDYGPKISYADEDRLDKLGIYDGVVFHLYAIEDISYGPLTGMVIGPEYE
jgi:hypothetical protein